MTTDEIFSLNNRRAHLRQKNVLGQALSEMERAELEEIEQRLVRGLECQCRLAHGEGVKVAGGAE